jgi:predicted RNA-binding protein with EMAP domain
VVCSLDTAKDARVLILEDALRRLNEIVSNRKLKMHIEYSKLGEFLKTAGSLLYEVKYSYTDAPALADADSTQNLVRAIDGFGKVYAAALAGGFKPSTAKERLNLAEVDYCLRAISHFQQRLRDYEEDPAHAVDILAVEVSQTDHIPGSSNLTECRCTDGTRRWTIVTNITGVKVGSKLVCAVLPPVEMMGVVSEAMFLGAEPLPEDSPLGTLTSPSVHALDHARAQVLQITKRMQ